MNPYLWQSRVAVVAAVQLRRPSAAGVVVIQQHTDVEASRDNRQLVPAA
jgi:hypothetical protein